MAQLPLSGGGGSTRMKDRGAGFPNYHFVSKTHIIIIDDTNEEAIIS